MPHTIQSILTHDKAALEAALWLDSSSARIEVQCLLQAVLQVNRAWLLTHPERKLDSEQQARYVALFEQRLRGEPLAYILGEREFYGLNFKISPATLIPRPDTELLVELALQRCGRVAAPSPDTHRPPPDNSAWALAHSGLRTFSACGGIPNNQPSPPAPLPGETPLLNPLPQAGEEANEKGNSLILAGEGGRQAGRGSKFRVLDLGTGSGAIALAIAHARPAAEVLACDASLAAIEVARENAQRLGIANATFVQSDWFAALGEQCFGLIVSNPPYIAVGDPHLQCGDVRFEPLSALASGDDGLRDIRHIVNHAQAYLQPGGWLLLEHGYTQAAQVRELLRQTGFGEVFSAPDMAGIERVSGGCIFA